MKNITVYPMYYHNDGIVHYDITWHSDVKRFHETSDNPGTRSKNYINAARARYILTQGNVLSIDEVCSSILATYKIAADVIDDVRETLESVDPEELEQLAKEYEAE